MYAQYFGLKQEPFSIAPDPRYLFMSDRHREALAHLLYGVKGGGGFVLLTGEIGAGKTTVCRCFLEQIPRRCNVAYIFNPKLTVTELLKTVCDEFGIPHHHDGVGTETVKDYLDPLNEYLLKTHAVGQNNVLIIDEAQNLSTEVLEQLRLLTNLETSERKLLQIILIGQPELREMLARPELEQLAQRVIARFHLDALSEAETGEYVRHRLGVAGYNKSKLFDSEAIRRIHQLTRGVPRRINLLCDRALLGAYADGRSRVDRAVVDKAASEVFDQAKLPKPEMDARERRMMWAIAAGALVLGAAATAGVGWWRQGPPSPDQHAPARTPAGGAAVALAVPSAASPTPRSASPIPAGQGKALPSATPAGIGALLRSEREALRELGALWGAPLGDGDPCAAGPQRGIHCFKSNGGLALIRLLGRPVVLTLYEPDNAPAYALMTALGSQSATLRVDGREQQVPLGLLARMWRGDFSTFWRVPPSYDHKITQGQQGAEVDWMAAQLARLQGEPPPQGAQRFDAALQAKVYAFQLAQGLKPDGVAGAITLMQLNRAVGVNEPRLHSER